MNNIIKLSRSQEIMDSRDIAMLRLDLHNFKIAEPVLVYYWKDTEKTDTDFLFAIGISNGTGRDKYRVLSHGYFDIVWGVRTTEPDVSELVNGEVYLYHNTETDIWYTVYLKDSSKVLDVVSAVPKTYLNLENNNLYISDSDRTVKSINDVYSKEEIDKLISDIKEKTRQSDWTETDSTSPSFIKHKPTIPEKILLYSKQELTDDEKGQARANIGAGYSSFSGDYSDLTNKPTIEAELGSNLAGDTIIRLKEVEVTNIVRDDTYHHTDANFTEDEKAKLGTIESGAEVNVQGDWDETEGTSDAFIKNKPSYSLVSLASPTSGYKQTLKLQKTVNGVSSYIGDQIDIAYDFVIKSGSLGVSTENDSPLEGYVVGDHYIDLIVNTRDNVGTNEHIYIKITTLRYTVSGVGLNINDSDSTIALKHTDGNGLEVTESDGIKLNTVSDTSNGAMTSFDKSKLDTIERGAEVNQNALTSIKVGDTTVTSTSKTDLFEFVATDDLTITPDADNKKITFTVDIPESIKNPYSLTVGTKTYDGSSAVEITKDDLSLGNVTNDAQVRRTEMGSANGVATLDSTGKVPSTQLPSYVDDVLIGSYYNGEFYTGIGHVTKYTPETGKIYVDMTSNKTYRWATQGTGGQYVEISESLALGETSETAYAGDKGKKNRDDIDTLNTERGKLTDLKTTEKTTIVGAINELEDNKTDLTTFNAHLDDKENPHSVTKAQVGLGNCDNTADIDKPVSTAQQAALDLKADLSVVEENELITATAINNLQAEIDDHTGDTSNPHSVTKDQVGLGDVVNTGDSDTPISGGTTKFTTGGAYTELNKKVDKVEGSSLVPDSKVSSYDSHLSNTDNPHLVTKTQVGLGNVDNTSDMNKPVSTAQKNALDLKADLSVVEDNELVTATAINNLQAEITNHTGDTSNPHSVTKDQVGLGNVDNTSDANKPVSGAQQAALDLKENLSNKVVSIDSSSTDTQYPSAKLVYDKLGTKVDYTVVKSVTEEYAAEKLLKYSEQTLTDAEKTQALTNLGIEDVEETAENAKSTSAQALATVSQVSTYAQNMTDTSRTEALAMATDVAALKNSIWSGTMTEFLALGSYSDSTVYQITED